MKSSNLLLTALLGLGISSAAFAQTTVPSTPGVPGTPGTPTTPGVVPGQPSLSGATPASTLPTSPAPVGTAPSTLYTPGTTAPADASGTLRSTQPVGTSPGQPTRRAGTRTTTPVRP